MVSIVEAFTTMRYVFPSAPLSAVNKSTPSSSAAFSSGGGKKLASEGNQFGRYHWRFASPRQRSYLEIAREPKAFPSVNHWTPQ